MAVFLATQLFSKIFPFLSTFFVLHLYSVTDFGRFGVFTTVATIVAYMTTLAYETPLLSSKNYTQLSITFFACSYVILAMCCLQFVVCWLIYYFCYPEPFILYICLYTFLRAFSFVVQNLCIRFHEENVLCVLKIADSALCNLALLGFGYAEWKFTGLITSSFLSLLPSLIVPCWFLSKKIQLTKPPLSKIIAFYKVHAELPRFIASARFIENLSHHLHTLLFSFLFNIGAVGQLYFAQRILTAPTQMLEFIAQFILKTLYHTAYVEKTIQKTSFLVGAFLLVCAFLIPLLYVLLESFAYGYIPHDILRIIEIILPLYLLTYLYQAITPFLIIQNKHKYVFQCYLGGTLLIIFTYGVGYLFSCGFFQLLLLLSVTKSLWFLLCILMFLKQKQENPLSPIRAITTPVTSPSLATSILQEE